MPKTALIFDPYLDTLGGGERYALTIAQVLTSLGWQVVLAWHDLGIIKSASSRFQLNLANVEVSEEYYHLFSGKSDLTSRYKALNRIDLVFFVSDGSIPILFGKKRLLHYQVPFTKVNRFPLLNQAKLLSVSQIVVNSMFTKKVIDKTLATNRSKVLYPPVDVTAFKNTAKKTKTILNVGRFASPSHSKRQDVLISAFKELVDQGIKDWKLVLAGGKFGEDNNLDDFKDLSKGYDIEFVVNPDFDRLRKLYASSTLYWHAAGYEVDEEINPESVEHFGITTVEAMAAGCVPLVINKGGQKEIVSSSEGFLWDTAEQLVDQTSGLIKKPKEIERLAINSQKRAADFSIENFTDSFTKLL